MASNIVQPNSSSTIITAFTINSLASDSTGLVGQQSDEIDLLALNSGNVLDVLISGLIKTIHTPTPTAGTASLYAIPRIDDTPTRPDAFGASDAARTCASIARLQSYGRQLWSIATPATVDIPLEMGKVSLASFFGGFLPRYMTFFLTQNTAQALNSSGNAFYMTPVWRTVG